MNNKKKMSIWMYQLAVYVPPLRVKKEIGEAGRCYTEASVIHPYREDPFKLYWLAPFHRDHPEYWDVNYVKPEK